MSQQSYYYEELQEMLRRHGCPICHVGHKIAHGQIESMLYDSVTDKDSRERWARSMGLCAAHSRQMMSFQGERLGATIIQWAVMREAQRRLQHSRPATGPSFRQRVRGQTAAESPLGGVEPCPVCQSQGQIETRSLRELLEHLVGDLDGPLEAAGGLCWPHLNAALGMAGNTEVHKALVALHDRVWQELIEQLAAFIRKRDYRFSHETITEAESVAVERALAVRHGSGQAAAL